MGKLYFLMGLPRSGKSSWAQSWIEEKPGRVIVCADDIRLACGHRWNSHIESYISSSKELMIKTLLQKHDVLVDGTHTTENNIRKLLQIDHNAQPIFINTHPEVCKKRAKQTNQEDLYPIIVRMQYNFQNLYIKFLYDNYGGIGGRRVKWQDLTQETVNTVVEAIRTQTTMKHSIRD